MFVRRRGEGARPSGRLRRVGCWWRRRGRGPQAGLALERPVELFPGGEWAPATPPSGPRLPALRPLGGRPGERRGEASFGPDLASEYQIVYNLLQIL